MKIEDFKDLPKDWKFLHKKASKDFKEDIFNQSKNKVTYLYNCYYCGLHNDKVECSGLFYCPNPKCTGPGGAYFRSTLKSYKELPCGGHTVDDEELDKKSDEYILNLIEKEKDKSLIFKKETSWRRLLNEFWLKIKIL